MSNSVIGALRVMLGMDTASFEDSADRAAKRVRAMETDFTRAIAGMQKVGLALAAALGGVTAGLAAMTRQTINTADEISKAAVKIGIGTEELSRLSYAADLSGVSFDALQKGLLILNRNMAGIGGESGKVADAFARMGVETRNADGSLKSATEVLAQIADAFAAMPDGAEKSALAMAVLGKAGADLIPLVNGGSGALRELTAEASRFGIVIDTETGQRAEEFNDNLSRMKGVFQALSARIAAEVLPSLIELQRWVISNQGSIVAAARSAIDFASTLAGVVRALAPLIAGVISYRLALLAASVAQAAYVVGMSTFAAVVGSARFATLGLNAALVANPFAAAAAAVGVLTAAFFQMGQAQRQARAETDNLIGSLKALAGARGADFIAKRNEAVVSLLEKQAELARYERKLDEQKGAARGYAAEALGPKIRALREEIPLLERGIAQADKAAKDAAQSMQGIVVPAANAGAAVAGAGQHARGLADSAKGASDALQTLLDRLYPYQAETRKFAEEMALIQKSRLSDAEKEAAIARLEDETFRRRTQGLGKATVSRGLLNEGPLGAVETVRTAIEGMNAAFEEGAKKTGVQTVRIADTVADMARNISSSLRGLVDGIRGGDFFSIFDGILNIVTSLGGAGLFGSKFQGIVNRVPGFASGGAMRLGGLAGIDRNILSLNGSPIARVSAGETMQIRPNGGRGGGDALRVTVTMDESTGALGAFVRNQAGQVVARAAPSIARSGASQSLQSLASIRDRSLA